jgi:hypothetical protein
MFRKTVLVAALALAAVSGVAGIARAEGESTSSNIAETLAPSRSFGQNAMALAGVPRVEIIAGMERPVVLYDGPSTQNFAAPSRTLRVVPNDNGSYSTVRG